MSVRRLLASLGGGSGDDPCIDEPALDGGVDSPVVGRESRAGGGGRTGGRTCAVPYSARMRSACCGARSGRSAPCLQLSLPLQGFDSHVHTPRIVHINTSTYIHLHPNTRILLLAASLQSASSKHARDRDLSWLEDLRKFLHSNNLTSGRAERSPAPLHAALFGTGASGVFARAAGSDGASIRREDAVDCRASGMARALC